MDRVINYPGQIPLETDLLRTNRNTMLEVSKLAASILGTGVHASGFACAPTDPASLAVSVGPGQLYKLLEIDATDYSSLDADSREVVKQGYMLDAVTLSTPAPGTAGQSINYLVQATMAEVDADPVTLPYYNALNPTHGYSGPNDNGTSQDTTRGIVVTVSIKAGTAASTGTQITPSPDSGYSPLWVVTVDHGDSDVDSGAIAAHPDSVILPYTLPELSPLPASIVEYSVSSTWVKPSRGNIAIIEIWGAGGGGGRGGATGNVVSTAIGGIGGAGGGKSTLPILLAELPDTVDVVIGAGGLGGTSGDGASGGNSTFGDFVSGFGGGGGLAGTTGTQSGVYPGSPYFQGSIGASPEYDINFLIPGYGGGSTMIGLAAPSSIDAGAAGGAGGNAQKTSGSAVAATGRPGGLNTESSAGVPLDVAEGPAGGALNTDGADATGPFQGGGGGGGATTGSAGAGGKGGTSSGGGGGGSSANTGVSPGNGGDGGDGFCRVTVY